MPRKQSNRIPLLIPTFSAASWSHSCCLRTQRIVIKIPNSYFGIYLSTLTTRVLFIEAYLLNNIFALVGFTSDKLCLCSVEWRCVRLRVIGFGLVCAFLTHVFECSCYRCF